MQDSVNYINSEFDKISNNFLNLKELSPSIENAANMCVEAIKNGNKIIFCGNGGSASDCQHLAAELVGRYKKERPAIAAIALTANTSIITAIANDNGYEKIFERQLEAIAKQNDVLIGISTSGESENVINAFKKAKEMNVKTIALTGKDGGRLKNQTDILLNVPSSVTNNIQEMHIALGHLLCDVIENNIFDCIEK